MTTVRGDDDSTWQAPRFVPVGKRALATSLLRFLMLRSALIVASQLEAAAMAFHSALYRFDDYRGEASPEPANGRDVESVRFVDSEISREDAEAALRRAAAVARGVNLARDLGNEPASTLTPEEFASRAQSRGPGVRSRDRGPRSVGTGRDRRRCHARGWRRQREYSASHPVALPARGRYRQDRGSSVWSARQSRSTPVATRSNRTRECWT